MTQIEQTRISKPNADLYVRLYKPGFVCYVLMAILALLFYKERTIFTDTSFLLFQILRTNALAIQDMRFGAAVTQVFPLFSFRSGVSLDHVMMIYSEGFIIYYLVCYIICGFVLKRYDLAIVLLLFNILFTSDTFYWIQSELLQGLAFTVVYFAYLCSDRVSKQGLISYLILVLGIITITFFHPLLIIPFYYGLCFLALKKEIVVGRKAVIGIVILSLLSVAAKNWFFPNAYDTQSMQSTNKLVDLFPHYLDLCSNRRFLHLCKIKYYWIPILGLANVIVSISRKKWGELALFVLTAGGFLLLVNVSHHEGDITVFYIESLYMPLSVILALPFVFDVLPVLQKKKLAAICIGLIIASGAVRIYASSAPYVTRLNWERKFMDKNANRKLLIYEQLVPKDTLMMTWGTPYEFWLLSTTERNRTASINIINNLTQYDGALGEKSSLIMAGEVYHYSELPKRYFKFTDTVTKYTLQK